MIVFEFMLFIPPRAEDSDPEFFFIYPNHISLGDWIRILILFEGGSDA